MLAVRIIHAAVGDDAEGVGFGEMADAHGSTDAAHPADVRLQNVDEAVGSGESEGQR